MLDKGKWGVFLRNRIHKKGERGKEKKTGVMRVLEYNSHGFNAFRIFHRCLLGQIFIN